MRRVLALTALWLFVLLSPVTTWQVIGDLSYTGTTDLDYMYEPPPLTTGQRLAIGITATAGALAAVLSTLAYRRRLVTWPDLRMALPLLLAGAYCGAAWRMMTAGGIGANIGGAFAVMFAPVFLLAMVIWFGFEIHRFGSGRWH